MNLAYGTVGLLFAAYSRAQNQPDAPDVVFAHALRWLPIFSLSLVIVTALASTRLLRERHSSTDGLVS